MIKKLLFMRLFGFYNLDYHIIISRPTQRAPRHTSCAGRTAGRWGLPLRGAPPSQAVFYAFSFSARTEFPPSAPAPQPAGQVRERKPLGVGS